MRIALPVVCAAVAAAWLAWARVGPRQTWLISPVLVILLSLSVAVNEWRWWAYETELQRAAAPVLGQVEARFGCERVARHFFSSSGHVGHVYFDADGKPADWAFLSMSTCSRLKDFRRDPGTDDLQQIVAAHTLAHEAAHLTGIRNEAQAECRALAADEAVMVNLGATPQQAADAVSRYRAEVLPRLPSQYRGSCTQETTATR
ncbi:MAG: hypothetical protein ACK5MT_18055 [Actinomycetales bacterium]